MNPEPKTLSLIVYDFDGTLVDTLADIADSANLTLKELNLRSLSREIIRAYVGGGMHRLMEQALNGTRYDDINMLLLCSANTIAITCWTKQNFTPTLGKQLNTFPIKKM